MDIDDKVGAQGNQGGGGAEPPDAELERGVLADTEDPGVMGAEVLGFGRELAVGAGEEQVIGDEPSERIDVGAELRRPQRGLERYDFWVIDADQNGLKRGQSVGHERKSIRHADAPAPPDRSSAAAAGVECFDYRISELLGNPLTLQHSPFDCLDATVAQLGVIVAHVDDDRAWSRAREQPAR